MSKRQEEKKKKCKEMERRLDIGKRKETMGTYVAVSVKKIAMIMMIGRQEPANR